jgi:hypothetical protein
MTEAIVHVENLYHTYTGASSVEALRGIDLAIRAGEYVALVGANVVSFTQKCSTAGVQSLGVPCGAFQLCFSDAVYQAGGVCTSPCSIIHRQESTTCLRCVQNPIHFSIVIGAFSV